MSEGPGRRRRRRGGRGGAGRQQQPQGGQPQQQGDRGERPPEARGDAEQQPPEGRKRRDTRRGRDRVRIAPAGTEQRRPQRAERTRDEQREPAQRRDSRGGREGRAPRDGRDGRDRDRDGRGRAPVEQPVPQDPLSVELGQKFREAQTALREAKKTLDKRKAEQGDEPEWLVAQLEAAERAFAEVATAWSEHLSQTGRKVVRR
jgi:ribonuclease E